MSKLGSPALFFCNVFEMYLKCSNFKLKSIVAMYVSILKLDVFVISFLMWAVTLDFMKAIFEVIS